MNADTNNRHRRAIELARENRWHEAHELIQNEDDRFACQIHACLHRIEGDQDNARYWYQRAGATVSTCSTDDELAQLADQAARS